MPLVCSAGRPSTRSIPATISGTIDANAGGDYAYGILSYGPMDVTVDGGTISAIANGGTNFAAIQSGEISGGALITQNADDMVEIVAGSTIHRRYRPGQQWD